MIRSRLSIVGVPVLVLVGTAAIGSIAAYVYKKERQGHFEKLAYRSLANLADAMRERVDTFDRAIFNHCPKEAAKRKDYQASVVRAVRGLDGTKPPEHDPGRLFFAYNCAPDPQESTDPPAAFASTWAELTGQVPLEMFDDLLIAAAGGQVLYQKSHSGRRFTNLNMLGIESAVSAGGKADGHAAPPSRDSGRVPKDEFTTFVHRARLITSRSSLVAGSTEGKAANELIVDIAGLIRTDRLEKEVGALPYSWWVTFLLVAVLLLLSMPLLKVVFLKPRERLSRVDGLLLTIGTFFATAVLTIAALCVAYFQGPVARQTHDDLQKLVSELDRMMGEEFEIIHDELPGLIRQMCDGSGSCEKPDRPLSTDAGSSKTNVLNATYPFPFFDYVAIIDKDGLQGIKWTAFDKQTPFVNLSDREFFRAAEQGRLWKLEREGSLKRFFVESLYSRNTAEDMAALSIPVPADVRGEKGWPAAAAVTWRPLSLIGPVVPPGFGFAIVNAEGQVLFHSAPGRNLREDLIVECDNAEELRSAILASAATTFRAPYRGEEHAFLARPVTSVVGSGWTLVAFRNLDYPRNAMVQAVTVTAIQFAIYSCVILALLAIALGFTAPKRVLIQGFRNPLACLWPDEKRHGGYVAAILAMLIAVAAYLVCLFAPRPALLASATCAIPVATLAGFVLLRRSPIRLTSGGPLTRYTLATVLLLILVAVMPCVAFFKMAVDFETKLQVRQGQFDLARQRAARFVEPNDALGCLRQAYLERPGARVGDSYAAVYFDTQVSEAPNGDSHEPSRVERWLHRLRRPYDDVSVQAGGFLTGGDQSHRNHRKFSEAGDVLILETDTVGKTVWVTSQWSTYNPMTSPAGGVFVLLVALLWCWMRYINRSLFLFGLDRSSPFRTREWIPARFDRDLFILVAPCRRRPLNWERKELFPLDLSRGTYSSWNDELRKAPSGAAVVLDRFENRISDANRTRLKMQFVSSLVQSGRRTIVLSGVDPVFHWAHEGEAKDQSLAMELARVLAGFSRREYSEDANEPPIEPQACPPPESEWRAWLADECDAAWFLEPIRDEMAARLASSQEAPSHEGLLREIQLRAASHYLDLWETCSTGERVVLVHLAEEGLVNPRSTDVVRELLRKGLVRTDRGLGLMNETFRRFLLEVRNPEQVGRWESDLGGGGWGLWRAILWPSLAAILVILAVTQKKYFEGVLPLVSAAATGFAALIKTFSSVRSALSGLGHSRDEG